MINFQLVSFPSFAPKILITFFDTISCVDVLVDRYCLGVNSRVPNYVVLLGDSLTGRKIVDARIRDDFFLFMNEKWNVRVGSVWDCFQCRKFEWCYWNLNIQGQCFGEQGNELRKFEWRIHPSKWKTDIFVIISTRRGIEIQRHVIRRGLKML